MRVAIIRLVFSLFILLLVRFLNHLTQYNILHLYTIEFLVDCIELLADLNQLSSTSARISRHLHVLYDTDLQVVRSNRLQEL